MLPQYNGDLLNWFQLVTPYDPTVNDEPIELQTKRQWEAEEVQRLLKLVNEYGHKWTLISRHFTNRTPLSIKKKFENIMK